MADGDIVISGISGKFPESDDMLELKENLFAGKDMVTEDDRRWPTGLYGLPKRNGKLKDLSRFDATFFGVHAKQADVMDPNLRHLLEHTHEAIMDAGINPQELRGSKTGVFVGMAFNEASEYFHRDPDTMTGYSLLGTARSMIANRVSYAFDFKGPSYSVDSACSSALFALHQAVSAIRQGDCDAAIVGAASVLLKPHTSLEFMRLSMLSPRGTCRSFDSSGDGYVRSEATGMLLLQKASDAKRIYATVVQAKTNVDGYKEQGITYPSGAMQKALIQDVFSSISVRPEEVSYVEAHGTGTKVGDPEEANSIDSFFCKNRKGPLLIGSVKSNMGHGEASAGLCSIAKVLISMETGIIPGNLYFQEPHPDIPGLHEGRLKVVDKNTPLDGEYVSINSFGFGGANGHVLLKSHKKPKATYKQKGLPKLVAVSGTTKESVKHFLDKIEENKDDDEFISLVQGIHKLKTPGHPHRGFVVLGTENYQEIVEQKMSDKRQLWYVFCGMGAQWNGMGKELMVLEPFSKAVFRCAEILRPEGVDLIKIINASDEKTFDNVLNSFVALAAVQIGLVDVLTSLGLKPDGILGHSVGELGCAYADGAFTAEQTILAAYWRGRSIQESGAGRGSMAVIGMPWDEVLKILPEGVYAVCNNSADNVTVSGPPELMVPLIERLAAEGVFARMVNSAGYAFHSKYIAGAGPKLLSGLEKIIPEPKPRTKRWISTSIPESDWSSELASTSSAAYHVHNLLNPVLFYQGVCRIPEGSVVVEVAPHHLLRPLLAKSLPGCTVLGLVKREVPDGIGYLLKNLGRIYLAGVDVDMRALYPSVSYPVGRNTAMISPMVRWDHSDQWQVPLHAKQTAKFGESVFEVDLSKEKDSYIAGHEIDGRVIYPGTGYLVLVWTTFAKSLGRQMVETPVMFEDVEIQSATIMTKNGPVKFVVSIFDGSGQFEISVSGTTALTGRIKKMEDWEGLPSVHRKPWESAECLLSSEDFYKDLRLRGYEYDGLFKGITKINISGDQAEAEWRDNWISFMDTVLQMSIFSRDKTLELPVRILKVIIDPQRHLREAEENKGMLITYNKDVEIIQCGGIEVRGVKFTTAPRRQETHSPPELEQYTFTPYIGNNVDVLENAIGAALQIVNENCGAVKIKIVEILDDLECEPLSPLINTIQMKEPNFTTDITLCTPMPEQEASDIKVVKRSDAEKIVPNVHLIVGHSAPDHNGLSETLNKMKPLTFFLYQGNKISTSTSLLVVAKYELKDRTVVLYRKSSLYVKPSVVRITNNNYSWVEEVKKRLKEGETSDKKTLLVSQGEPNCGVVGLMNCLRMEPGGYNLRYVFIQDDKAKPFSSFTEVYLNQLKKDLFANVLNPEGLWGSYRHFSVPPVKNAVVKTENAFVNVLTRGDLASLRWIQGPKCETSLESSLCTVYYASLNFRDVMIAAGKLSADSLPGKLVRQDCILGIEFSGRNAKGERVMGAVECRGLSTTVVSDPILTWTIPEQWTLQEAASVPIVYATAYYSLIVRGSMRQGESILIHAGTGGVGQAAINIALQMGCRVFTTVGTEEKRRYIKATFPQLNDRCIGNSRDTSFEQLVLTETKGKGVDLVLNSLADEKLQSSVRCLALGGRFLEIGKLDLSKNTALGMAVFLKNASVHGVLVDSFMSPDCDKWEKNEIRRLVSEGIASGAVKPIPQTTFDRDQIEASFRYMAAGKHIGKVIIKIRDEESSGVSKEVFDAIPRTFLDSRKSYVILGGLGGFGLELADWLITRNATKIVLVSRSGVRNGFQTAAIKRMERNGATVLLSNQDSSTPEGARTLLGQARSLGPVGGIFNLAAVIRDAFMENQTEENFKAVCKAKIDTTLALDTASRSCNELDYFVAFSSVSCGRGNPGQPNYAYANSSMERICEARKALGLPATVIQWGAIGDVGIVLEHMKKGNNDVIAGTIPQRINSCLAVLDYFLQRPEPILSSTVVADKGKSKENTSKDSILYAIANILGLKDPNSCLNKSFAELGMDSLMGTEVKQTLERNHDLVLSAQEIRALTFQKLQELSAVDSQTSTDTIKKQFKFKNILPKEVIVKMPSNTENSLKKNVFFIHPVEGHVLMLEEVTGQVNGLVFGLQCVKEAPLESNERLAAYYIQKIKAVQKDGPYLIVGYSFGTIVAMEMGLQLEKMGQEVRLVLIDGSPAFLEGHTNLYKVTRGLDKDFDAFRLSFLAMMFSEKEFLQVQKEMLELKSWDLRLKRCSEIMSPFSEEEILDGNISFTGKLNIGAEYKPKTKFNGDITLIRASESFIDISDDYELKQYCNGKFINHVVTGSHQKILQGKSSTTIADIINQSFLF